jgi:Holliday junction resolvase RusA-like endonuclease
VIGTLAFTVPGTPALVDPASSKPLSPDLEWAMNVYSLHARGSEEQMAYLSVPGDPWSKSRPRFTRRGRTYQPRDDSEAEAALAWRMKTCKADPFSGNVMLACRFYRSNFQRVDADNLLKHVCDSANGVLWKDDSQVTFISGELLYDAHEPRTLIVAGNHTSSLVRGVDAELVCPQCGRSFMPASRGPTKSRQRFCSQACQHAARRTGLRPRR